jgi:hypothetical protein
MNGFASLCRETGDFLALDARTGDVRDRFNTFAIPN